MNSAWPTPAGTLALLICIASACSTSPPAPSLSSQQAMTLALQLANAEAMRLFDIKPFNTNRAEIHRITDHWQWHALVGFGKADIIGRVTFRSDGSDPQVRVEMCTSYHTIEPRFQRTLPNNRELRHLGPPEQMPK